MVARILIASCRVMLSPMPTLPQPIPSVILAATMVFTTGMYHSMGSASIKFRVVAEVSGFTVSTLLIMLKNSSRLISPSGR